MLHESKCRNVHGHRYTAEFTVAASELDGVGRVVDFGVVKNAVGSWIEDTLDHGYIHHPDDQVGAYLAGLGHRTFAMPRDLGEPTAENLAALLGRVAGEILRTENPDLLVQRVRVYETPNCWADWISCQLG